MQSNPDANYISWFYISITYYRDILQINAYLYIVYLGNIRDSSWDSVFVAFVYACR